MSEGRLRLVSLSILGGSLHGRRHNPDEVVAEILIGSDPDCHLVVELPGISPIHAKVWADLSESTVYDTSAPRGVYVNTERVEVKARIGEGDVLWLGPPQEPQSVCLKLHFEPWVEVLPNVSVESYDEAAAEVVEGDEASTPALTTDIHSDAQDEPQPEPRSEALEEAVRAVETVEVAPVDAAPVDPTPVDPTPVDPTPVDPTPVDPTPVDPTPVDPTPVDPTPVDPTPVDPTPVDPTPVDPTPVDPAPADPAPADPVDMPGLVEPAPSAAAADDPFFVGEESPGGLEVPPETAPAAPEALAEDWAISEAPSSEPEPAPVPAADEFFVAGDPEPSAPPDPLFIEADAVLDAAGADPTSAASVPFLDLPPLAPPPPPPPAAIPPSLPPAPATAVPPAPRHTLAPPAQVEPEPEPEPPQAAPTRPEAAAARPTEAPAAKAAAAPRSPPATPRRPVGAAPAVRATARKAGPRPATRAGGGQNKWLRPAGLGVAVTLLVGGIAFAALKLFGGGLRLDAVEPARLRVGQRATLSGSGFGSDAQAVTVAFGDREARVLQASPKQLEVEVPEAVGSGGAEGRVTVVVRVSGRTSGTVDVAVFQGPRLHGLSPGAAMPGEEVMLAGAGWGIGASVRFGSVPAQIVEVQTTQIRAIVPELPGGPGTEAPVVVSVGGVDSNQAPFILGHLPVLSGLNPASAAPGDVVNVSGRGFETIAPRNDVRVGGIPALVIASSNDSLQLIVPRLAPGDAARAVELRVPGSANVGQALLQLKPQADPIDFRFVAEPFAPGPGRLHALLATGFGPAFVLAASGGMTAAERAAATADRLNAAAQPLRTTVGLTLEARGIDSSPVIGLVGRPEALIEVTEQDAAAYNEDWTGLRGRGGPVTRARLARWWEALARDLVLITVRAQAPQNAAALAPEGRVLVQLFEIAQRGGATGVPRRVVEEARPPLRDGLRLLGLRVPASVTAPSAAAASVATATVPAVASTPTPPALQLDGSWGGSQVEQGQRQYLTVTARGSGGTVAFEGGITFTVPMLNLEKPRRDQVRFSVQIRGGVRHYAGRWDGEAITGNVSTDAAGKNIVASFELRRR